MKKDEIVKSILKLFLDTSNIVKNKKCEDRIYSILLKKIHNFFVINQL